LAVREEADARRRNVFEFSTWQGSHDQSRNSPRSDGLAESLQRNQRCLRNKIMVGGSFDGRSSTVPACCTSPFEGLAEMVSCFGKILLVATSLAPVCGAFAVNRISSLESGQWLHDGWFWAWTIAGIGLLICTWLFLLWCSLHLKHTSIQAKSIKPTDKDVLAFLLAYLLPLFGADSLAFSKPIIAIYISALIFLAVYHSNSFHFNPMLALNGYHFYDVETDTGFSAMLISKRSHVLQEQDMIVVKITDFLLLEVDPSES
jgi:hypothetical protein